MSTNRIEELRARLATTRSARELAEAAVNDDDRAEIALREELAKEAAATREAGRVKRELDLARRLDAAADALGPGVILRELAIKDSDATFILKNPGADAYRAWEQAMTTASVKAKAKGGKVDDEAMTRNFAAAAVYDWNGITDFGPTTTNGHALHDFFKKNPGIATKVWAEAMELAGTAAEERKSGG